MNHSRPLVLPTARIAASNDVLAGMALAGALIAYGMRRRGAFGFATGVAGAGLLASLVAPRVAPHINPTARALRAIDVSGSFIVARSPSEVFAFLRNFEHFPLLGGVLHSVEDFDDGRSRWRVAARDGTLIEWNVIVTKYVPSRVIAWESVRGGPIESSGTIRFTPVGEASTRVSVTLHYRPLTEAAAQAFRPLVRRRPERRVLAAIGRIEAAMQQAEQPGFYDRKPQHPLPDPAPSI